MTEAIPISSIDMEEKLAWNGQGDILGKTVTGITAKVESEELFVKGAHVIKHYLSKKPQNWIATGDLVSIDEGYIILKGRKKDMILRRSYNIYPGLFEPTIQNIEGVQACALFGVYDDKLEDEKIILAVETEDSYSLTEDGIMEQLKNGENSIDANALPDKVVFIKIPRAGRQSKIDKNSLRNRYK
jgi:acyl-CoA synthetase (AMP-forming)/AMP-acid ligase II